MMMLYWSCFKLTLVLIIPFSLIACLILRRRRKNREKAKSKMDDYEIYQLQKLEEIERPVVIIFVVILAMFVSLFSVSSVFEEKGKEVIDYQLKEEYAIEKQYEENEKLVLYFLNEDKELERKEVNLNFTIVKTDEDKAFYRVYRVYRKQEFCNKYLGCEVADALGNGLETVNKLYLPKEVLKGDSLDWNYGE